jgi:hypothetical protein
MVAHNQCNPPGIPEALFVETESPVLKQNTRNNLGKEE